MAWRSEQIQEHRHEQGNARAGSARQQVRERVAPGFDVLAEEFSEQGAIVILRGVEQDGEERQQHADVIEGPICASKDGIGGHLNCSTFGHPNCST